VEIVAAKFFGGDKMAAYDTLRQNKIWSLYVENYDTTHTLGADYILDEVGQVLRAHGTGCA
jgi:hypothetical protein